MFAGARFAERSTGVLYIQCTEFQNPIYKTKSYTFFQNKYSQTHAKCSRNTLVFINVSGSPKDDKKVKRLGAIKTLPIRSESRDALKKFSYLDLNFY